jgi:peroxiredoxin
MRSFIFSTLFFFILLSCQINPEEYRIQGKILGLEEGMALLKRRVDSEFITIDSSEINMGIFTFRGSLESPEMCYVYIADTLPYLRFFNENARIRISSHIDSLRNPEITGSSSQDLLSAFNLRMLPFEARLRKSYASYRKASQEQDKTLMNEFESEFDRISEEQKTESLLFIRENYQSVVSAYLIWGTLAYDLDVSELEALSQQFPPEIQQSIYVKQIEAYIKTLNKVAVGQTYTDIVLPDPQGNLQRLSQLNGKLIMINFWASWCGPCRRENPDVVALYHEFKDRDFEIFGVSLDESRGKWEKAIEEDNLTWHHVSDLKGWNSEAGRLYGVRSIPHTVLIDKHGNIVAINLRGDELRKKVAELLKG